MRKWSVLGAALAIVSGVVTRLATPAFAGAGGVTNAGGVAGNPDP